MSVQDLIWVEVAQSLKKKELFEFEKSKIEANIKNLETFYLTIADIRVILRDSNYYERISALKDTGMKKIEPLEDKYLPSLATEAKRIEDEKLANMTPEEIVLYKFTKGERVTG